MKGQWTLKRIFMVMMLLAFGAGTGFAQEPTSAYQQEGWAGGAPQALLGTAFTYQGHLKTGSVPVDGTCDFRFRLYDATSGGTQIGTDQYRTDVSVNRGLFTVQLDFGAGAFQGDARWLAIAVRCPAGSGSYIALSPRQALTPAPYALALPGLWTEQTDISPNLIGGYSGNTVLAGVKGATIGGGGSSAGPNSVTAMFGTVGGGESNRAGLSGSGALYSTVGGGFKNIAGNSYATVGGGSANVASGGWSTIGGGSGNHASSFDTTIGGGNSNWASGWGATVGGGGSDGTTSAGNQATGSVSTIGGGMGNTASGYAATVPGGYQAAATHYGEMAYASGKFANNGDAQSSLYVMRGTSTGSAWTNLYLDGSSALLTIASGRTVAFEILVVGRSDGGESAGYQIRGVMENVGGTINFLSIRSDIHEDDPAWDVRATADFVNKALLVQVQGNGENIRWVAAVRTAEVAW